MTKSTQPKPANGAAPRRLGIILTIVGLLIFLIGADPGLFGTDISPVIGFVQVTVFSFGLFVLCLGGTLSLNSLWPPGRRTIIADLGLRLAWTGLVIALTSGMADVFGVGTRPLTETLTFFGYWQARGVLLGEIVIILGFLMMIPFRPIPISDKNDPLPEINAKTQ